ncbi:hypothetical protein RsTz2092_07210 [Deferribacterales bacterium RsTz2092]|nr:hypothetical protein AGMMS49941_04150 [Deferribacterales bacterium]
MPIDNERTFDLLVENAMGFMKRSLADLSKPEDGLKYAVINFYTAIELFLKARILKEHWTLIVSPSKASLSMNKFLVGDFKSVSFEEIKDRLKETLNTPLKKDVVANIDKVRQHRNKMVHFYHPDYKNEKDEIIADQMEAWHDLNRLLIGDWKDVFSEHFSDINEMHNQLKTKYKPYRARYYKEQYDKIKGTLTNAEKCSYCGYEAVTKEIINITKDISLIEYRCRICRDYSVELQASCPHCRKTIIIPELYDNFVCPKCDKQISYNDIVNEISPPSYDHHDLYSGDYYGCSSCGHTDSVVPMDDGNYFCTCCFSIYDSMDTCEWCGQTSNAVGEYSGLEGCDFCDGNPEWNDLSS